MSETTVIPEEELAAMEEELREVGAPVRCCPQWPECEHMEAWAADKIAAQPPPAPAAWDDEVVIGMDTKSRSFHWCCDSNLLRGLGANMGNPLWHVDFGYHEIDQGEAVERARAELYWAADRLFNEIRELLDSKNIRVHVFCEEPLSLKNGATSRILALAAGAIWSGFVSSQVNAWWYWVDASTWKKEILGRGAPPERGTKHKDWIAEAVPALPHFQAYVPDEIGRGEFVNHPDLYDAFCIMRYGASHLKEGT